MDKHTEEFCAFMDVEVGRAKEMVDEFRITVRNGALEEAALHVQLMSPTSASRIRSLKV